MSEVDGSNEIIIKGGSVNVQFDSAGYTSAPGGKHEDKTKKITQIVVRDDKGVEKFSIADKSGLKLTVTVSTEKL